MKDLNELIHTLIQLREEMQEQITLLAVCPNSSAVLEAAVKAAALYHTPMLFAATLNQVDTDGGYTGWTPGVFVEQMKHCAEQYQWDGPLYACLDHGGPWLKDRHTLDRLSLDETMGKVKDSVAACVKASYSLLHIDPTVDRSLSEMSALPVERVVERTVELIAHAENTRIQGGLPSIAYEVGTEEVHGGLVEYSRFEEFIRQLRVALEEKDLAYAWPCFMVAQVGTDLHTTTFDDVAARRLYQTLSPLGCLAKGHYSDWVDNPEKYPQSGMGGANVGPEFTAAEYQALMHLVEREESSLSSQRGGSRSQFKEVLTAAVVDSGRWKKWLQADERGLDFVALLPERQDWLLQTGSRYIWTQPAVVGAREKLYANLATPSYEPHEYIVDQIVKVIEKYVLAFNLKDSISKLYN